LARFVHIVLAALVMASSSGIVLTKHYCQGEFRSQALFIAPESCHSEREGKATVPVCPFHAKQSEAPGNDKKGCCDNRSAVVKSDAPQWHKLPELLSSFTGPQLHALPALPEYLPVLKFQMVTYLPEWATGLPPPKYGLQVWLQVFRH